MPLIDKGSTWRTPDLWVMVIIVISTAFGVFFAKMYREKLIPVLMKSTLGRKLYSIIPIIFAVSLFIFYVDAGLYLLMEDESNWMHLLVGFVTCAWLQWLSLMTLVFFVETVNARC